jgi:signal transduction histidine kinase
LVVVSWVVYFRIESVIFDKVDDDLRMFSHSISETLARDPNDLRALAASIEASIASSAPEQEVAIELYDERLNLILKKDFLAPFPNPLLQSEIVDVKRAIFRREQRAATYPYFIRVEANGQGFTRSAVYGGPAMRELEEIRDVFVSVLAIGVALTALVGSWLARQTLRPLSEINKTAKRVSSLGNEGWLPTRGTGDELDELASTLNSMLEGIRHATDSMKRFAAQAAHELLTPLGIAQTRIEVTLSGIGGERAYREALKAVLGDIEQLALTVNGILEIARSGAGLDPKRLEMITISDLVSDIADFYRVVASDQNITLGPPPSLDVKVVGDPVWLNRLFSNLIDNAIKYSRSGSSVNIEIEEVTDWLCISIRDAGVGIAVQDRRQIFDHFFRADRTHTVGHGLGLSLAMEIARAHGGSIQYEGPETGGSVFRVRLPVAKVTEVELANG